MHFRVTFKELNMTAIGWIIQCLLFKFVVSYGSETDTWDEIQMICPNQCVCQQTPFMDLSVARWIQALRREDIENTIADKQNIYGGAFNEAFFENDESHLRNQHVKFVMCILQGDIIAKDLVVSLPQDTEALVLLHNGHAKHNISVSSNDLLQFENLEILEIRSTGSGRHLEFFIDQPMPTVKHANFESINIIADEMIKKGINFQKYQSASENYDYKPDFSRYTYENDGLESGNEEIEIKPYHEYIAELTKSKRPNFFGWQNLEVLRIHNCHLDEVEWEMFAGLNNLLHLSLEHNEIKVVPQFAFYGAEHLKTLSLARNQILDLHYLALAGLLELEHLDLSANNMTRYSEATFPPFPSLKSIDLKDNPVEFILPMSFAVLNGTSELILGSHTTALELANTNNAFLSLDNLKVLNILNMRSPKLYQSLFKGLNKLERLQMKGYIVQIEFDAFVEMPKLKELILSGSGIQDISMDAFYDIEDLRILDLSKNQLKTIPTGLFGKQQKLTEVYLQHNYLTKLPSDFFASKSLKLVRLTENPWIFSCVMSNWNQAVTNAIRLNKITKSKDVHCIRNPKTGRIEKCTDQYDDFPEYAYGFDNQMAPQCNDSTGQLQDVYYILRHNVKCKPITANSKRPEKQRESNKLIATMAKLNRSQNEKPISATTWESQQWINKQMRKLHVDSKINRTKNTKIVHEQQVHSNDIDEF